MIPKILIRQRIVSNIFSKIPLSILGKLTGTRLIHSIYHMISNDEVLHTKYLYPHKNITQFKDDLDFLLRNFFPINLFDLIDFLKHGRALPDRAMLLTFDDGFREMHNIVSPLYWKREFPPPFL